MGIAGIEKNNFINKGKNIDFLVEKIYNGTDQFDKMLCRGEIEYEHL